MSFGVQNFDDPFRHVVESYLALGYDQEEVALALALHSGRAEQDQVCLTIY